MSQNDQPTDSVTNPVQTNPANSESDILTPVKTSVDSTPEASSETLTPTTPEDESTIGTGTSMALGCIAGTVILIVFGLLFLALATIF